MRKLHDLVRESHLHLRGLYCQRNPFPAEQDFGTVTPCVRAALLASMALELFFNPGLLALCKVFGERLGTPSRNGHSGRAVWLQS